MEQINVEYQVNISDFRKATYYGMFLRHRMALRIMFVVVGVGILYAIAGSLGFGAVNPLVLFLALAYLIWGILLFAGAERGIRAYLRSGNHLLGCTYRVELDQKHLRLEVPERGIRFATNIAKLTCVFEMSAMFLLYTSMQDVYILPMRCLSDDQRKALRSLFKEKLGNNFGSRFK